MTLDEVIDLLDETIRAPARITIQRWLDRGDGAAVYQNHAMNHSKCGHTKVVSFGSPKAQIETDEPPERLPDIGGEINWMYRLIGTCKEQP